LFDPILVFLDQGLLAASWWQILIFTLVATHITIAGVTIFLHRCQAHRALDLHPVISHFFRFWLWLTTGMVTREWAAIHRKHHAKCETAEDPHSPVRWGLRKVLLEGAELYRAEAANRETVEKYGHGTPDDWIERRLYSRFPLMGVLVMLAIDVMLFGVIGLAVYGVQMLWIPVLAAGVINGLGHAMGYRNFDCPDASTNIVPWGILIGGEELHNNHHACPTSAKLSNKWYEFDIGWLYIRTLQFVGLARVKKIAPRPRLADTRAVIDFDALQAVIAHRYDVMHQFARSLREACADEARRLAALRLPEGKLLESARHWLHLDAGRLSGNEREQLPKVLAASERLSFLIEMRRELGVIWERSNRSAEQLVSMLQQWCQRADASGIPALEKMSIRIRSYAAAA
jgi:stearoyl-CoA desaturase (delta-9 desaturase)